MYNVQRVRVAHWDGNYTMSSFQGLRSAFEVALIESPYFRGILKEMFHCM